MYQGISWNVEDIFWILLRLINIVVFAVWAGTKIFPGRACDKRMLVKNKAYKLLCHTGTAESADHLLILSDPEEQTPMLVCFKHSDISTISFNENKSLTIQKYYYWNGQRLCIA